MLRKILFAIYGGTIGAACVLLVNWIWPMPAALLGAGLLGAGMLMAGFAVEVGTVSRGPKTDIGRCFSVAILPLLFAFAVFVGVAAVMLMPIWLPVVFIQAWREGRRFQRKMEEQGRFARARDLEPKLAAGHGTLIEEHGPKSVERIWYTDDDVRAQGSPANNWDDLFAAWKAGHDHAFNATCRQQYLDRNSGRAILTTISPSSRRKLLGTRYPRMAIVTVFDLAYRPKQPPEGL